MKKQCLSIGFLASLLGLAAVGCSDEAVTDVTPISPAEEERITVIASAGMAQGGADTRVDFEEKENKLGITWRNSGAAETFSVLKGTQAATPETFTLKELDATDSHKATFEGEITPDADATYYAVYPKVDANLDPTAVSLDMTGQVGVTSADNLNEGKTVMYAASQYADGKLSFSFAHLTSVLKLTLKFPDSKDANVPDMGDGGEIKATTRATTGVSGITLVADGMASQATVDITGANVAYTTSDPSGSLALNGTFSLNNELTATIYIHVLPGTWKGLTVEAKMGGKKYVATVTTNDTEIKRGLMYRAMAEMEEAFIVTADAAYAGRVLQFGITTYDGSSGFLASGLMAADGMAALPSGILSADGVAASFSAKQGKLAAGRKVWFCIPKVAKFFHALTAEEIANKTITLPDKDGGSTLKASPVIDGKAYENEWIVALYMGINKDGSTAADATPIYWATGNLIATKTNSGDERSNVSFHVATLEETKAEADAKNTYVAPTGIEESDIDGYIGCAKGTQWNMFGWGDISGVMTSKKTDAYFPNETICGNPAYDIACAQLGGSWRLPTGFQADGSMNEYDGNELAVFMDAYFQEPWLTPDGEAWGVDGAYIGRQYAYEVDDEITNTLYWPAAGARDGNVESSSNSQKRGSGGGYRSGTWRGNSSCQFAFDNSYNGGISYSTCHMGFSVRPVTE